MPRSLTRLGLTGLGRRQFPLTAGSLFPWICQGLPRRVIALLLGTQQRVIVKLFWFISIFFGTLRLLSLPFHIFRSEFSFSLNELGFIWLAYA